MTILLRYESSLTFKHIVFCELKQNGGGPSELVNSDFFFFFSLMAGGSHSSRCITATYYTPRTQRRQKWFVRRWIIWTIPSYLYYWHNINILFLTYHSCYHHHLFATPLIKNTIRCKNVNKWFIYVINFHVQNLDVILIFSSCSHF